MKKVLLVALCCTSGSFSQEKLDALTAPSSPAASVLGIQPSVQLRPKSYRTLETALYSNFGGGEGSGVVPNDFGLEFMPYWATDRGVVLQDYLLPQYVGVQLVRNSSFSIATSQKFLLEDSTTTKSIALGYRTSVFIGNKNDQTIIAIRLSELRNQLDLEIAIVMPLETYKDAHPNAQKADYVAELQRILPDAVHKALKNNTRKEAEMIAEAILDDVDSLKWDDKRFDSFLESVLGQIKGNYESFKSYLNARQGFSLDFAGAVHLNFPSNDFEFSKVPKYALWLTPSYNFSNKLDFLKATATVRYERYFTSYFEQYFPDSEVFENNLDYGVALSGTFKKFSLEFELSGRTRRSLVEAGTDANGHTLYRKEHSNDTQYLGSFTYRITEQVALSYQLGSAFEPAFRVNGGTVVSLLSLNLGFGGPDKKDVGKGS